MFLTMNELKTDVEDDAVNNGRNGFTMSLMYAVSGRGQGWHFCQMNVPILKRFRNSKEHVLTSNF